jgi:hypothetical protein
MALAQNVVTHPVPDGMQKKESDVMSDPYLSFRWKFLELGSPTKNDFDNFFDRLT